MKKIVCFPLFLLFFLFSKSQTVVSDAIQSSAAIKISPTGSMSIDSLAVLMMKYTASPTYIAGSMVWDGNCDCVTSFNSNSNVSLQNGQEVWVRVLNNSGSTIANGSAVYISGSSAGLPTISLAKADIASTTIGLGLTTESINNGSMGFVTALGVVNGLNTSGLAVGSIYISNTTAGALTQTVPAVLGQYRYRVGFVTSIDATIGKIHVTPTIAVRVSEVTNSSTVGLNAATLNSTYPSAQVGDRVLCGNITLGGAIYTKYTTGWLMTSAPTQP